MDQEAIKQSLKTDIFLMDKAAVELEKSREILATTTDKTVDFWKESVKFWEEAVDESIEILKGTYHWYLKS